MDGRRVRNGRLASSRGNEAWGDSSGAVSCKLSSGHGCACVDIVPNGYCEIRKSFRVLLMMLEAR